MNLFLVIFAVFNLKQLKKMNSKVVSFRKELFKYQQTRVTVKDFKEKELDYEELLLRIKLPKDRLVPSDLFKKIINSAKKAGIEEIKISQSDAIGAGKLSIGYSEVWGISFKTEFKCDYDKTMLFLKELFTIPCLVNVSSLNISRDKEDSVVLDIKLTLDTYTILEKNKPVAEAAVDKLKQQLPQGMDN